MIKDSPVPINPKQLKELCDFKNHDILKQKEIIKIEYLSWKLCLGDLNRKLKRKYDL